MKLNKAVEFIANSKIILSPYIVRNYLIFNIQWNIDLQKCGSYQIYHSKKLFNTKRIICNALFSVKLESGVGQFGLK